MSLTLNKTPRVAIMGRPNVGKSTLFNVLTRSRKAVVKNQPGVTRDVQIEPTEWWGKKFDVVDTGGVTDAVDEFSGLIKEQVSEIIKHVDLLVVVMDAKTGLVPEDRDIIRLAKQSGKPSIIVVNKVDRMHDAELLLSEFYEFGLDLMPTSFERRDGIDGIVEWIKQELPEVSENTERQGVKLAIVGKPNVGKSSLSNFLLDEKRMLVSDIAGTTVDAIEAQFTYNEQIYTLVDTAGLRRNSKIADGVEKLSSFKTFNAIDKADIVLLMVDGTLGPSVQEAKIVNYILARHKAVILVANKWDIAKEQVEKFKSTFKSQVDEKFHFFMDVPLVFTSAKTGAGINSLFDKIEEVWGKLNKKIKTSKLNDFLFESIRLAPAPVYGVKDVKFYYLTQTHQTPPSFIAFANHPEGVTPSYRRFLSKKIKQKFDLSGIPIRIFCMKRKRKKSASRYSSEELYDPVEGVQIEEDWVSEVPELSEENLESILEQ